MAVVAVDVRHARSTTQKAGRRAVDTAARDQNRLRTRPLCNRGSVSRLTQSYKQPTLSVVL